MACLMSLVHLQSLISEPQKLKSIPFMEHLQEFHLDIFIPRYCNSPQVSCLGMNSGRVWNPNFERTYLLEQSESEAKTWPRCTSEIYLRTMKVSAPDPSPISRYSESTKTISFSILGFFRPVVKLGFDFSHSFTQPKISNQVYKIRF